MQQSINSNLLLIQKNLPFPLDLIKYGTPAENFHRCSKMLNRRQLTFLISRPCHVMRRRPLAAPGPDCSRWTVTLFQSEGRITPTMDGSIIVNLELAYFYLKLGFVSFLKRNLQTSYIFFFSFQHRVRLLSFTKTNAS